MKKILTLLAVVFLLWGCSEATKTPVVTQVQPQVKKEAKPTPQNKIKKQSRSKLKTTPQFEGIGKPGPKTVQSKKPEPPQLTEVVDQPKGANFIQNRYFKDQHGRIQGKYIRYHKDNGKIFTEYQYKDSNKHGPFTVYDKDGETVIREGEYAKHKPIGVHTSFAKGKKWIEAFHENGKQVKRIVYRTGDGSVVFIQRYDEKGRMNNQKLLRSDGSVNTESIYVDGSVKKVKFFDRQGKLIKEEDR